MSDRRYYWALIVGPKSEAEASQCTRYHARDDCEGKWAYEEQDTFTMSSVILLVRIVVGKVTNDERLQAALRRVPIVQGDKF